MPRAHCDLPDEELMLACARGDAAAFLLLHEDGASVEDLARKLRGCLESDLVPPEPAR